MKTFRVYPISHLVAAEPVLIGAEYMKIENGALVFRSTEWLETEAEYAKRLASMPTYMTTFSRRANGYPKTVRVFAPGAWREVELVP